MPSGWRIIMDSLEYGDVLIWLILHRDDREMMEKIVRAINADLTPVDLAEDFVYWSRAKEIIDGRMG